MGPVVATEMEMAAGVPIEVLLARGGRVAVAKQRRVELWAVKVAVEEGGPRA